MLRDFESEETEEKGDVGSDCDVDAVKVEGSQRG